MKVLLTAVNAKYIHSNLAIYSMKAYAEQKGCPGAEIQLAEYTINQQQDGILRGIYEKKPDLLCFSCYIWNISFVRELIRDVKKILPKTRIWVGGPEVSYDAEDFLKEMPQVTGVICGEGEETFAEVVRTYAQWEKQEQEPGKLADVPGIVYRDGEKLVFTGNRDILNIFLYLSIRLFIMKAAGDVLFPAATVFLLLIRSCGFGAFSW